MRRASCTERSPFLDLIELVKSSQSQSHLVFHYHIKTFKIQTQRHAIMGPLFSIAVDNFYCLYCLKFLIEKKNILQLQTNILTQTTSSKSDQSF